jgi:hypothetical protein
LKIIEDEVNECNEEKNKKSISASSTSQQNGGKGLVEGFKENQGPGLGCS